jgi:hypothetical protein
MAFDFNDNLLIINTLIQRNHVADGQIALSQRENFPVIISCFPFISKVLKYNSYTIKFSIL